MAADAAARCARLLRLTRPYPGRTALAVVDASSPTRSSRSARPYLAKLAVDDGIRAGDLARADLDRRRLPRRRRRHARALRARRPISQAGSASASLADLRNRLFAHLQRLSLGFFERNRTGAIISRITNDVEALDQLVTDGVTSLVQNSLLLVGTAVVLVLLDWRLALATFVVVPLVVLRDGVVPDPLEPRVPPRARAHRPRHRHARGGHRGHARRPVVHARADRARRASAASTTAIATPTTRRSILNGLYFPVVDLLSSLATAIVLGYGGYLLIDGELTIGTLLAFTLYLSNFFDPVQQLSQLYNTFLSATAALDKIIDVLDEEPDIVDAPGAAALPRDRGTRPLRARALRLRRAARTSRTGSTSTSPPGTTVALVGHTGAGKSTIAKLLARFYDPREGRITIDGHDLRDVTQASLRRQLGIVPQEGFLFAGTVARQHRLRPTRRARDGDRCAPRAAVGARRFIARARGGLRHAARRARLPALAGPAPARRVRARAARRPAHPHPRRGDLLGRHRHRAADRARRSPASRRPHGVRHRAPALDDPERRPDRRARARADRGAGRARGADRAAAGRYTQLYGDWAARGRLVAAHRVDS